MVTNSGQGTWEVCAEQGVFFVQNVSFIRFSMERIIKVKIHVF